MEVLKHYKMKIEALSPIHIGNGVTIGKKEYIRIPWDQLIIIPDFNRMYLDIQKKGHSRQFEKYILENDRDDLSKWLKENGYQKKDYERWEKYRLSASEAFIKPNNGKASTPKDILAFAKDAYGMPYVPGSSIKGMIRTALLAWEIHKNPSKYQDITQSIWRGAGKEKVKRDYLLSQETAALEELTFHTVKRDGVKPNNAVWSNMAGLIVSDSEPISIEQLTLSQKIDYNLRGEEKALPILREALIPGTEVFFSITIDPEICPYSIEHIVEALNYFQEVSYDKFYKRFHRGKKEDGIVWLGGGVGFLSKTILYPMFKDEAYKIVDKTFVVTVGPKNYQQHKHGKNLSNKIAPHVCKCTRYNGQLYDMGMGRLEVLK